MRLLDRRRLFDVRGIAAVVLAIALIGSGGPVAAAVRHKRQAWSHVVTPAQTDVPTFFGSGHGPSSSMIVTSSRLEPDVEMGPDLFQAVYYALQGGATEVVVVFTADDAAATLGSAIDSYSGLPASQASSVGDLFAVPALADLSVEDHLSVASKLIALAARLNGLALLEPPTHAAPAPPVWCPRTCSTAAASPALSSRTRFFPTTRSRSTSTAPRSRKNEPWLRVV